MSEISTKTSRQDRFFRIQRHVKDAGGGWTIKAGPWLVSIVRVHR